MDSSDVLSLGVCSVFSFKTSHKKHHAVICLFMAILQMNLAWPFLPHAVNCGRFCFSCYRSMVFCLYMKYLRNRWTDLYHICAEDMFSPSLRRVWRSRSKVKVTRGKNGIFSVHSAACVWFMLGKTSLALSFCLCMKYLWKRWTDLRQIHTEKNLWW